MSTIKQLLGDYIQSVSELNNDDSVEELFEKLQIGEIQKLNVKVKENAKESRESLHALVGAKYRSLIRIAEDIGNMYEVVSENDKNLSRLCYGKCDFFSFIEPSPLFKFESLEKKEQREKFLENSIYDLLLSIVNDNIIPLSLEILFNEGVTSQWPSSRFVQIARFFYTLEAVFQDELMRNETISKQVHDAQEQINGSLESELVKYTLPLNFSTADDSSFYAKGQFTISSLLCKGKSSLYFDETYDDYLLETNYSRIDEDDEMYADDDMSDDDLCASPFPIVNYIVANIVLNAPTDRSLRNVLDNFVNLRVKYLDRLLKDIFSRTSLEDSESVNFLKIFKYYDSTIQIVKKILFQSCESLRRAFERIDGCNSNKILGTSQSINPKDVNINFGSMPEELLTIEDLDASFKEFPLVFFDFCTNLIKEVQVKSETNKVKAISMIFLIVYDICEGLIILEESNGSNQTSFEIISSITSSDSFLSLVKFALQSIEMIYHSHLELLAPPIHDTNVSNISMKVRSQLINVPEVEETPFRLFSSKKRDYIANNVDDYMTYVSILSCSGSSSVYDEVLQDLENWFNVSYALEAQLLLERFSEKSKLVKLIELLDSLIGTKVQENNWKSETKLRISDELKELNRRLSIDFAQSISRFQEFIDGLLTEYLRTSSFTVLYKLLRLLVVFERNARKLNAKYNKKKTILDYDHEMSSRILSHVIKTVSSASENDQSKFEDEIVGEFTISNSSTYMERPSIGLISLLLQFSQKLIDPMGDFKKRGYSFGDVFLSAEVLPIFVNLKNDWIRKTLIEEKILLCLRSYLGEISSNQECINEKESLPPCERRDMDRVKAALSFFIIQLSYLLQFTQPTRVEIKDPLIQQCDAIIAEAFKKPILLHTEVELLLKNAADFYECNKGLYLPLLNCI